MEPDILASAGDPAAEAGHWSGANTVQTEESTTVETPPESPRPQVGRLHAVTAHAPAVPRSRVHAGGFANGHARPRATSISTWHAPAPAVTTLAPAVLPFEAPLDEGAYLRAGKRILDVLSSAI